MPEPADREPNDTSNNAVIVSPNFSVSGTLIQGDIDYYQLRVFDSGLLHIATTASFDTRISLYREDGTLLIHSDGQSLASQDDHIQQFVVAGTYLIGVESLGEIGEYALDSTFKSNSSFEFTLPNTFGESVKEFTTGNLNNDEFLDLVILGSQQIFTFLGTEQNGFTLAETVVIPDLSSNDTGWQYLSLVDMDGDTVDDVVYTTLSNIYFFHGEGDGSVAQAIGSRKSDEYFNPYIIFAGHLIDDFNGDFIPDVASGGVLYVGDGSGSFYYDPALTLADFDPFLANIMSGSPFSLNYGVVKSQLNDDLLDDYVGVLEKSDGFYSQIAYGQEDGSFLLGTEVLISGDVNLSQIFVADIDGNGHQDIALIGYSESSATSVQLNLGDGLFSDQIVFQLQQGVAAATFADVDFDGRADLITASRSISGVQINTVLKSLGDGSFETINPNFVVSPSAIAQADFNRDGFIDIVVGHNEIRPDGKFLTVALGAGDGSFSSHISIAWPDQVPNVFRRGLTDVIVVDINQDGRDDLLCLIPGGQYQEGGIISLLGVGDGKFVFGDFLQLPIGGNEFQSRQATIGDFNHDGNVDIAVALFFANQVQIATTSQDGNLQLFQTSTVPSPMDLVTTDINGDGRDDLAVASRAGGILLFVQEETGGLTLQAGTVTSELTARITDGDFNGDGKRDLAVITDRINGSSPPNRLIVFLNDGSGNYSTSDLRSVPSSPHNLISINLNSDTFDDLVIYNRGGFDLLSVYNGSASGVVDGPVSQITDTSRVASDLTFADINRDGVLDVVYSDSRNNFSVLLGVRSKEAFVDIGTLSAPPRAIPRLADITGDGVLDLVIVDAGGDILLRPGNANDSQAFEAPILVNPNSFVLDATIVKTPNGTQIAAIDGERGQLVRYVRGADGTFTKTFGKATQAWLASRIASGDLNGDNRDDLVILSSITGELRIYLQNDTGGFLGSSTTYVGAGPVDIQIANVNGQALPDVVIANQISGDISVLVNDGSGHFPSELRYRAGEGPYSMDENGVFSRQGTTSAYAGLLDGDSFVDLFVVNAGQNSFSFLQGNGTGGFENPQRSLIYGIPDDKPVMIVAGKYDGDDIPDVAVLGAEANTVTIYSGGPNDTYTVIQTLDVGDKVSGLTQADVNQDNKLDLIVGNEYGDVLILYGVGDGTFQPFTRAERNVPFVLVDLDGDGVKDDVVLANQARDQIAAQQRLDGTTNFQDVSGATLDPSANDDLLGPGAIQLVDVNGDGIEDLIVANSSSNSVLVYFGTDTHNFVFHDSYFAGTNPSALLVAHLNDDDVMDIATANRGSNDVSILFGQGSGATWTTTLGPRLDVGAGPISLQVQDVATNLDSNGDGVPDEGQDGIPDLVVVNSQTGTLTVLPGVGGGGTGTGFFNDGLSNSFTISNAPLLQINNGFGVTNDGQIVRFGFNGSNFSSNTVFASTTFRPVNVQIYGNDLLTSNTDGTVSLLAAGAGGLFTEVGFFSDPNLVNPNAIALATIANDLLQIYVTDEGDQVVTVFDLQDLQQRSDSTEDLTDGEADGGLVIDASSNTQFISITSPIDDNLNNLANIRELLDDLQDSIRRRGGPATLLSEFSSGAKFITHHVLGTLDRLVDYTLSFWNSAFNQEVERSDLYSRIGEFSSVFHPLLPGGRLLSVAQWLHDARVNTDGITQVKRVLAAAEQHPETGAAVKALKYWQQQMDEAFSAFEELERRSGSEAEAEEKKEATPTPATEDAPPASTDPATSAAEISDRLFALWEQSLTTPPASPPLLTPTQAAFAALGVATVSALPGRRTRRSTTATVN